MRLLNVTTKRLESFYGFHIPEYAILSHTWGKEEDEVLFKHVAGSDDDRREGESRKGYAKLSAACEQAKRDEWKYIWIDTCCINKESSAELSEAINSMYAWYEEAEVCYAYLEDVQDDKETQSDGNSAAFKTVPFEKSRWFSRGWTLQELIAPQRVVFYSGNWVDIGTKATLRDVISAVTDIRVEMITNYDPDKASVAEKMSWAAKRQTTKVEDIAYCLVGLLGVNMPLLYGEGMKAFRRLQEEVMKTSDDHSIFAWKTDYRRYRLHSELISDTRGMLADSPWSFLGAGNVGRSNDEGPYPAYSMSNKGLQIGLPILSTSPKELTGVDSADSQDIFKAILDCTYRDTSPARWVVIYLKMVGNGRYVRIFPYWLDETQVNPNEADRHGWVVTSLLVPQVTTPRREPIFLRELFLKILPTESGYRYRKKGLVKGHQAHYSYRGYIGAKRVNGVEVFNFDREERRFGVVFGFDYGRRWMDIITEDDYKELGLKDVSKIKLLYEEGGSRSHMILEPLNLLCTNISKDHSVEASRKPSSSLFNDEVTIDIRRITTQVPVVDEKNLLEGLGLRNVHPNSKKEGIDWFAIFNPRMKRVLELSPLLCRLGDKSLVGMIIFSPNGKYLATVTNLSTVRVFNTTTGDAIGVLSSSSIPSLYIHHMCFSPNGSFLAIGTYDGRILLWDIKKNVHHDFGNHQSRIKVLRFSPDRRFIISVSEHGQVRILDLHNGSSEDVCNLGHKVEAPSSAAISPNTQLVAGAQGDIIQIWDLNAKQLVGVLRGHSEDVSCMSFTPDGKGLVSGSRDRTLKYWRVGGLAAAGANNAGTGPHVAVDRDVDPSTQCIMDIRHEYDVSNVAVSHDGNWIISLSRGMMQFWDSRDGTVQFMLRSRVSEIKSFGMSPADTIFATHSDDNGVQTWEYNKIGTTGQS